LGAGAVATVLAIGVSDAHTAPVVQWIDSVLPEYRGLRDSSKWIAVLALLYSQLGGFGIRAALRGIPKLTPIGLPRDLAIAFASALVLAAPLYYGNGLLYGMHGQVQPSSYPAGWYLADRAISADKNPGRALFLPWHEYLALSFVKNTNRVVSCPAPQFFSIPVVSSQDLEIPGISPPQYPDQVAISALVKSGSTGNWSTVLASRDIKYVLLEREVDWKGYAYLNDEPGLVLVGDYGSILVYRNLAWGSN
jgi:hypothetical protein